ncbi:MAG TPA: LacI family DNA-binding transcriptional regulator [Phycisphaerae bacterium]|nr:LacI family DNA-binding transcriptional regulator [Phycisphaerae bacterium]
MKTSIPIERIEQLKAKKSIGLRDLAALAEVDTSTVSRALNQDPRVSEHRRKMIRQLAEEIGYRPRPLRANRSQAIGLLIASSRPDRPDAQFLDRMAWLAQRVLGERNLHVNLECVERRPSQGQTPLPAVVQQNRVDGVLVAGHPPAELIRQISELRVPVVAINDSTKRLGISCVRSEPTPAIHQAILRLAALGHRRFGLLMNSPEYPSSQARYKSYVSSLEEIGITPDPAWVVMDLAEELKGGREGIRDLDSRGPMPSAILCCNDWMALGALHELQRRGLSVPGDVSLVGHDNLRFCEETEPTLTSIHRDEHGIVAKAVDLLLEQVNKGDHTPREVLVEGEMVWRESTAVAPDRAAGQDK